MAGKTLEQGTAKTRPAAIREWLPDAWSFDGRAEILTRIFSDGSEFR